MLNPDDAIPAEITFEQAIALTQSLLSTPDRVGDTIAELVKTENGARGFFVTYLTSEETISDRPSPEVIQALQSSPSIVGELLVKNLAMSAAMAVTHRRRQDRAMAESSERVRSRTAHLIKLVKLPVVNQLAQQLWDSAATGDGNYAAFLQRWGYDAEQRQVICQALAFIRD